MKRILAVFCLFLVFLATSCKKNRTCECTSNYSGADTTWTETNDILIEKSSKKDAQVSCSANEKSTTLLTETLVVSDCHLK